ncbi:hypothetical protein [Ferrimonas kyonanensis]|uniref:hypothetical protein n=1 Tax=Ferrimonas kyonanensis TaxID=364763 RepID=UPI0004089D5B|nr:hypothetical protein [Ferrimonas kyonanensis]
MVEDAQGTASQLPFIIGVSGHRKLDPNSTQTLRQRVREALVFWRQQLTDTPIWLLSGMAVGADTLVVEVARELRAQWGPDSLKIIACLPMDEASYLQDFEGLQFAPNAVTEFHAHLAQLRHDDDEIIEVQSVLAPQQLATALADTEYGEARNHLYLNQSVFVAKYAQVLLSLWDGAPSRGSGGTADAVAYKLGLPLQWPLGIANPALAPVSDFDGQQGGVVHHVPAVRPGQTLAPSTLEYASLPMTGLSGDLPEGSGLYVCHNHGDDSDIAPSGFLAQEFRLMLKELRFYNQHASGIEADAATAWPAPGLQESQRIFLKADAMALNQQTRYRRLTQLFFLFALIALGLYEVVSNFLELSTGSWLIAAMFAAMLGCYGIIRYAGKRELKWQYQLARGVAEGMRIRGFLNLSAIAPSPTPLIPRRFRQHLPLIEHAISVAELDWWRAPLPENPQLIRTSWLDDQRNFLNTRLRLKEPRRLRLSERFYKRPAWAASVCERWASELFNAAVIFGIALLGVLLLQYGFNIDLFVGSKDTLMYFAQYALMAAGAIALWGELAGYDTTARGYRSLEQLYRRAQHLLDGELNQSKQAMLIELAKEAMFEHVTWTNSESDNDLKQKQ